MSELGASLVTDQPDSPTSNLVTALLTNLANLLESRSSRHGIARLGDPLAPRARIQRRFRQARMHHGEHVVGCRHAGAAVADNRLAALVGEQGIEAASQRGGCEKPAITAEVALERRIQRAGDMARDGVDGFVLAAETVAGPGVEKRPCAGVDVFADLSHRHRGRNGARAIGVDRRVSAPAFEPRLVAAIQHRNGAVPRPADHPPQPGSDHAARVVVGDDLRLGLHAVRLQHRPKSRGIGQRMPTRPPGFHRPGQVVVQVQVRRARNVALGVASAAGLDIREVESAIEDADFGGGQCREIPGTD